MLAGTASHADLIQAHGDGRLSVIAYGPSPRIPGSYLIYVHSEPIERQLKGFDYSGRTRVGNPRDRSRGRALPRSTDRKGRESD